MSNYALGTMLLELPKRNANKFLNLFLSNNKIANKKKRRYFFRTTLETFNIRNTGKDTYEITVNFTFAGSLWDCLIDTPSLSHSKKCVKLKDICKELDVGVLVAVGEEPIEGVKEKIRYIKGKDFYYDKYDMDYSLDPIEWDIWKAKMEMEAE